jgi:hypothetical protein
MVGRQANNGRPLIDCVIEATLVIQEIRIAIEYQEVFRLQRNRFFKGRLGVFQSAKACIHTGDCLVSDGIVGIDGYRALHGGKGEMCIGRINGLLRVDFLAEPFD